MPVEVQKPELINNPLQMPMKHGSFLWPLRSIKELMGSNDISVTDEQVTAPQAKTMSKIMPVSTGTTASTAGMNRLRVAAYARVSTDYEGQKSSISIQKQHFNTVSAGHNDWEFAGVYYDIISGTSAESRPGLNRLLTDCERGSINLILTKSISRFARNTTDLLHMVRKLTALGTDIVFERERIDTRTMGSEFLLTILASLAEEESHSISSNCRWAIQKRFRDGTYKAATAPYGYDLSNGTYVVNSCEAEIVKEIFSRFIKGQALKIIADDLNQRGILTKHHNKMQRGGMASGLWTSHSIRSILRNISYIGDLLLQKVYADSSFKKVRNKGEYPQYYLENHHPPVISDAVFQQAQAMLDERRVGSTGTKHTYPLSGKLLCQNCGSHFQRKIQRSGIYWICGSYRKRTVECSVTRIAEKDIWMTFNKLLMLLHLDDSLVRDFISTLDADSRERNGRELKELEERLESINSQLSLIEAGNRRNVTPAEKQTRLNALRLEQSEIRTQINRMTNDRLLEGKVLLSLIHSYGTDHNDTDCDNDYPDVTDAFLTSVDKVTVSVRDGLTFHFKCGLTVTTIPGQLRPTGASLPGDRFILEVNHRG